MTDRDSKRKDPIAVLWASNHRNVMTQVAKRFGVTPQFCHLILYSKRKSRDGRIERALREYGAPIKLR